MLFNKWSSPILSCYIDIQGEFEIWTEPQRLRHVVDTFNVYIRINLIADLDNKVGEVDFRWHRAFPGCDSKPSPSISKARFVPERFQMMPQDELRKKLMTSMAVCLDRNSARGPARIRNNENWFLDSHWLK
jgi:hypothetical protein